MAISSAFPSQSKKEMSPEVKDIQRLLDELTSCNLTNWEDEFVSSLQERIAIYGGSAVISEKQGDWLNRLAEKYDLAAA